MQLEARGSAGQIRNWPETRETCSHCALASDARLGGSSTKRGTMAASPGKLEQAQRGFPCGLHGLHEPAMCLGGFGAARSCTLLGQRRQLQGLQASSDRRCEPKKIERAREKEKNSTDSQRLEAAAAVGLGPSLTSTQTGKPACDCERCNLAAPQHWTLHGASASQPQPARPTARGPWLAVVALTSPSSSPSPPIASSARP